MIGFARLRDGEWEYSKKSLEIFKEYENNFPFVFQFLRTPEFPEIRSPYSLYQVFKPLFHTGSFFVGGKDFF
jgi:hypothetical protein